MTEESTPVSPRRPSEAEARRHLVECLRKNPVWEADDVLASRASLLRVCGARSGRFEAAQEEAAAKARARESLQGLRESVWKKPIDEIRDELGRIDTERFPDLRPAAGRLGVIVEARTRLPGLTTHKDFDGDFFDCFKGVLSGSPAESAQMRERVAMAFVSRPLRRRGRKMLKLLEREVPELCALERAWFAKLRGQKATGWLVHNPKTVSTFNSPRRVEPDEPRRDRSGCLSGSWFWIFITYCVIQCLIALARMAFNSQ